ncbi:penicillin amidase [Naegleria gruberi]|uniref:Penicillin amidase n=1 Tax=Naegleria gruberi TaxID=5762 RepID=D2VJM6_NAEGR|nr:penicillin amidase [Naegleria gruberi]EFC42979.1 penicillin amidase [Naegleria gruberi]|eukprot:XP_002675723.1 penicillin amidase [Naegleria gruberi strain NEG-M]
MLLLEGATFFFCIYHLYNIYKFFKTRARHSGKKGISAIVAALCSSEVNQYNAYSDSRQGNEEDDFDDEEDDEDDEEEEEEESKFSKFVVGFLKIAANAIAVLCFIILVLFTVVVVPLQQQTYPTYNGTLKLPKFTPKGSSAPTISRESNGVVHIKASHDYDLYFAQGVAVAQDRLWQLEFNRRLSNGILAEVAGADAVNVDSWFRTLGFARSAANILPTIDAETLSFIQAYCDGINSYINSNPPLQPEFVLLNTKPVEWTPSDVIAYMKFVSFSLSDNMEKEVWRFKMMQRNITKDRVNELVPFYPTDMPTILSLEEMNLQNVPVEEREKIEKAQQDDSAAFIPKAIHNLTMSVMEEMFASLEESGEWGKQAVRSVLKGMVAPDITGNKASNNWVLGTKITANNGSLLANDPHLDLTAPGIWYLAHLEGPTHNVIGSTFVGLPGIVIGKNDFISWGVTTGLVDAQDLYVMSEVEEGKTYNYNGKVLQYETRTETINVKGAAAKTITVKESVYGPVINDHYQVDGNVLCLKSLTTYTNDTTLQAFLKLNREAKDWNSFVDVVSLFVSPSQNFVFADKSGNIGYYLAGLVPIRKEGHNGRFPVIGDGSYDWQGFIPAAEKPSVYNPKKDYIASANNRVTPVGYKYSITQDWYSFYRASRIVSLIETAIEKGTPLNFEYMKKMQHDVHSPVFDQFKFVFEAIPKFRNLTENKEKLREKLINWDGDEILYSQSASIFEMWYKIMGNLTKVETVNRWSFGPYLYNALKNGDSACENYHNTTCMLFAIDSFENAIDALEATYGSIPLWGSDIHESEFPNPVMDNTVLKCLAGATRTTVGGSSTINVGETQYPALNSRWGVSYRQVVDWRGNQASFIIPLGQSGNFLSPLYTNLLEMWSDPTGQYLDMKSAGYTATNTLSLSSQ